MLQVIHLRPLLWATFPNPRSLPLFLFMFHLFSRQLTADLLTLDQY